MIIFNLKLWVKSYGDGGQNFQVVFSHGEKGNKLGSPWRRRGLSFPREQFLMGNKFLNVWQDIMGSKICSNQMFFVPLESSQNIDIQNDLMFSISSYELNIYDKKKKQGSNFPSL